MWQALVFVFGGVRDFGGRLSITPHLPSTWDSLEFSLRFRDRQLDVVLTHEQDRVTLREGAAIEVCIRGREHVLTPDDPVRIITAPVRTAAPTGRD